MQKTNNGLDTQILKLTSLLVFAIATLGTIINLLLKLDTLLSVLTAGIGFIGLLSWYTLKRKNNFKTVRLFFTIFILISTNAAWYFNFTSTGPILTLFLLMIVMIVFIWEIRIVYYIVSLVVINLIVLFLIDYKFHEIFTKYPSEIARIGDVYFGTIMSIIIIFVFSYQAKVLYLKKYSEAKKSDQLKTAFLATMSHELRTPLNSIIGFSDYIEKDMPVEKIIEFTKMINSSGNHLLTIINDLFDLSLIESDQINIVKKDVELLPFLDTINDIILIELKNAKKENIDLKLIHPEQNKNLTIYTDPSRLKQILINLLKNAIKFTNNGHIHYGFTFETGKNESLVKFFIEDTGIGIPKEKKEQIFEIFTQVENTLTRNYNGAGIGLSISKKLVVSLGGNIWVDTEIGRGSTFYFTIPTEKLEITNKKDLSDLLVKSETLTKNKKTILIVEDDDLSFQYLNVVINKNNIHSLWAKNGKESIIFCEENADIDLVLMDINMPIMNGMEAAFEIKKLRPNLPIIAQTAYATHGDKEKFLKAGFDDYISKPIKKQELIIKINKYIT